MDMDSTSLTPASLCLLCNKATSVIFCKECHEKMCTECKRNHDQILNFKSHPTAPLCSEHGQAVTHLCGQCLSAVCIKCMLSAHKGHEETFEDFQQGVAKLKGNFQILHARITKRVSGFQTAMSETHRKVDKTFNKKEELKYLKEKCLQKIEKVNHILKDIEENYELDGRKRIHVLEEVQKAANIHDSETDTCTDIDFVAQLSGIIREMQSLCEENEIKLAEPVKGIPSTIQDQYEELLQTVAEPDPFVYPRILNVRLRKYLSNCDISLDNVKDIGVDNAGRVFLSDFNLKFVLCLDKDGCRVRNYSPINNKDGIKSICLHKNKLYILQSDNISSQITEGPQQAKISVPYQFQFPLSTHWRLCVTSENSFIVLNKVKGNIYQYSPREKPVQLVKNLTNPLSLAVHIVQDVCMGAAVTTEFHQTNVVNIYDENWRHTATIGQSDDPDEQLSLPLGVLFTASGDILVADRDSHRIACFSSTGRFISNVITSEDGLRYPSSMAYKAPHLWVVEYKMYHHLALKCFELSISLTHFK